MWEDNRKRVRAYLDSVAPRYDGFLRRNAYHHKQTLRFHQSIVPPGKRVLCLGCTTGDALASVRPGFGVGVERSAEMVRIAREKYATRTELTFHDRDLEEFDTDEKFDFILFHFSVDYLPDLWPVFLKLRKWSYEHTKVLIVSHNPLWEFLLRFGARLGLRCPDGPRTFVTNFDLQYQLYLAGFDPYEKGYKVFLPKYVPGLSAALNRVVPRLPGLHHLCFMQYIVARPVLDAATAAQRGPYSCTVVIPCFNEEGNVAECVRRVPRLGRSTEILVVDDGSADRTAEIVNELAKSNPDLRLLSYRPNRGKGHAVKAGFEAARGDVVMILDADMTVMPEELDRFLQPIEEGKAEFVNGTRMLYPMEGGAMKLLNFWGNKLFGIIISLIIGQRNTDTLCGTKAMLKRDFAYVPMTDPSWGDFDLIFGAARLKLKTVEVPVHYLSRRAGESKMKAFKHGWKLLLVCWRGLRELY